MSQLGDMSIEMISERGRRRNNYEFKDIFVCVQDFLIAVSRTLAEVLAEEDDNADHDSYPCDVCTIVSTSISIFITD